MCLCVTVCVCLSVCETDWCCCTLVPCFNNPSSLLRLPALDAVSQVGRALWRQIQRSTDSQICSPPQQSPETEGNALHRCLPVGANRKWARETVTCCSSITVVLSVALTLILTGWGSQGGGWGGLSDWHSSGEANLRNIAYTCVNVQNIRRGMKRPKKRERKNCLVFVTLRIWSFISSALNQSDQIRRKQNPLPHAVFCYLQEGKLKSFAGIFPFVSISSCPEDSNVQAQIIKSALSFSLSLLRIASPAWIFQVVQLNLVYNILHFQQEDCFFFFFYTKKGRETKKRLTISYHDVPYTLISLSLSLPGSRMGQGACLAKPRSFYVRIAMYLPSHAFQSVGNLHENALNLLMYTGKKILIQMISKIILPFCWWPWQS